MDDYYPEDVIDFWSYPQEKSETVEFLVHTELVPEINALLEKDNVTYRVKFDDFQMIVEQQMRDIKDTELDFDFR